MKSAEALIAWSRGGPVKVGRLIGEGEPDWTGPFECTGGAAHMARRKQRGWCVVAMTFVEFNTLAVNYQVPIEDLHREFLKIDEYRWHVSPDALGAEEGPDAHYDALRAEGGQ